MKLRDNVGMSFIPNPSRCPEYAVVDEVGLRPFDGFEDFHHLGRGVEAVVLRPCLLAAGAFACPAPVFFLGFFHDSEKMFIFASEKPRSGEVPLPLVGQIQISNLILTFQTLIEIVTFIRLLAFRFSYSLQGFRNPLCQSLLTLQRYEIILKLQNVFKIIFTPDCTFSIKNLRVWNNLPIFAASKSTCGHDAAVLSGSAFLWLPLIGTIIQPRRVGSQETAPEVSHVEP